MASLFLSYASEDRAKAHIIARALEQEGYSVWWDRNIQGGADFGAEIERELQAAQAVVVLWSIASAKSEWVRDEAAHARDDSKLVPVQLDDAGPPLGFRQRQSIDLRGWKGDAGAAAFRELISSVNFALTGEAAKVELAPETPSSSGMLKWIAIVFAAIVLALFLRVLMTRPDSTDSTTAAAVPVQSSTVKAGPHQQTSGPVDQSIAVMPFTALSAHQDDSYFGKGVAEELLNALAQIPNLKVATRTSAFSFEDQDVDLRQIANTLRVAHIVEGSVRRSGERLRVTAQLIRANDGFQLWSETYERQLADIFDIQDEIVAQLSRMLQFRLGVGAGTGRATHRNINPLAYEKYLQGLEVISRSSAFTYKSSGKPKIAARPPKWQRFGGQ